MSISNNFRELVLLVGTNPLPNLVVAKHFLNSNKSLKRISLIYSEQTTTYKDSLINLIKRINESIEFLEIQLRDVRNPKKIRNDLEEQFYKKIDKNSSFHLNYTGGTKTMVIHCYKFLEDNLKGKVSFSYLSSKDFKLIEDSTGDFVTDDDLRDSINIHIEDMVELHNYKLKANYKLEKNKTLNEIIKDFNNVSEAMIIFDNFLNEEDIHEAFYKDFEIKKEQNLDEQKVSVEQDLKDKKEKNIIKQGYKRELFLNSNNEFCSKYSDLMESKFKDFIPNEYYEKILKSFPEKLNLFDENWNLRKVDNNPLKQLLKFLDGNWFEYYICSVLKDLLTDKEKYELLTSIKISRGENKNADMEIDLTFINGYELFCISCTTDSDYHAKSKGFEVIHRAKQLGGDEAKAILISTMKQSRADNLQQSLKAETGSHNSFMVLGLNDLKKEVLEEKILEFIFGEG